jgi:HAD superfamily hydrolase (TIGR01509 family)
MSAGRGRNHDDTESPRMQDADPSLRTPRGLLFDLDGTLVDSEHLHYESTAAVLALRGVEMAPAQYDMYVGWAERDCWVSINRRFGLGLDPDEAVIERNEAYVSLLRERTLAPLPGVESLLAWSHARGMPMAVASSLPLRQIDASLAAAHLDRYLPVRRSGHDDVAPGRGKPEPDVYLAAAAALGLDAGDCWAFEDSATGMRSAHAAGCLVVGIPCASHPCSDFSAAHLVCDSFDQALSRLRGACR